jgi:hypothetical protein
MRCNFGLLICHTSPVHELQAKYQVTFGIVFIVYLLKYPVQQFETTRYIPTYQTA